MAGFKSDRADLKSKRTGFRLEKPGCINGSTDIKTSRLCAVCAPFDGRKYRQKFQTHSNLVFLAGEM